MPKNKEHGLRKGLSARMAIVVSCEWYECQETFDNMSAFNKHVTLHLEQTLLASDVTTGEGKEPGKEYGPGGLHHVGFLLFRDFYLRREF